MDYWDEVMQDDVYLIADDGWAEAAKPRGIIEDKEKKIKETPDLTIKRNKYKMDLIPPGLIVARYFAADRATIEALQADQETATRELEEFVEEHTGEDGLLQDAANDKGKITKTGVTTRLKIIRDEPDSEEEREVLTLCLDLIGVESRASKAVRDNQSALDQKVLVQYAKLSKVEIKTLVIEEKWFASIYADIQEEVQRLTQKLTGRIKELDERYARPLPELEREVDVFSAKVEGHLKKMGIVL